MKNSKLKKIVANYRNLQALCDGYDHVLYLTKDIKIIDYSESYNKDDDRNELHFIKYTLKNNTNNYVWNLQIDGNSFTQHIEMI